MLGRYFYFEANGSNNNTVNFYTEIQIVDRDGVNRAFGRGLARYSSIHPNSKDPSVVTDGDTNTNNFFANDGGKGHIVIDLGDVYDISYIKIWRYYGDGRTFKGVFIKVSKDDVNYTTVFSSEVDGTYKETAEGKQIDILNFDPTVPLFRMPLKDSLEYTGESFTVSVSGSTDIVFEENAFSATTNSDITIALPEPLSSFTIFFRFKIYSTGVSASSSYRGLIGGYGIYDVKFFGAEIEYADGKTTNKLVLGKAFTDALDDGNWHTCVVKKEGSTVTCTVDDTYTDTVSASYALEKIKLSNKTYVLNGLIKDVSIYKYSVDDFTEPDEPDEPETPALVIGPDIRITEGMTIIGGVLHRIVLTATEETE